MNTGKEHREDFPELQEWRGDMEKGIRYQLKNLSALEKVFPGEQPRC